MPQATSYNITSVQGAREDLSNQLKRVAPEDTPMYSLLPQSAAPKAVETSWIADDLGNPAFGSPPVDGADLSFDTNYTNEIANRVRLEIWYRRIKDKLRVFSYRRSGGSSWATNFTFGGVKSKGVDPIEN